MAEYIVDTTDGILHARTTGELVRCKECRYAYEHHDARGRWLLCGLQLYDEVKPEDFCSRGEAEEDKR
jgi:hypothetical protein